ncbi:MAG: branched-chain amino acid ABC transporter permease [Firmicutes bacterium]|nr:branched-chain amino acid ABC transporter permease [Bacillota bacterium]
MIAQEIVNGLVLGAIYALMALGYTMVYGILRLINFAQGSLYTVGAYVAFLLVPATTGLERATPILQLAVLLLAAMLATGVLAVLVDLIAYRPLRRAPLFASLVSSLAMMVLLENLVQVVVGAQPETFPTLISTTPWLIGPLAVTPAQVVLVAVAVLLMAGLQLFTQRTRLGRAMRAVAVSHDTAAMMGIPVNRVIALTFFLGGALGAAAGILVGLNFGTITFNMGDLAGLKAFTAAVLGGIGNIPGAVVGAVVLGLLESLSATVIPTQWTDAITFGVLILVLALRPRGILGERVAERV